MSASKESGPAWYRIPVVWVCIVCATASLGACILTIAVALEHRDALAETAPVSRFLIEPERAPKTPPNR